MTSEIRARLVRARSIRVVAVVAAMVWLEAASASAEDVWVGTRNAASGQIAVRTEVLKQSFPDGAPVGGFAIREAPDGLLNISNGFLLVRHSAAGAATCRTEATPVVFRGVRAYLDLDAAVHTVLLCANPLGVECGSCRIERDLQGWYCACIRDGSLNGECDSRMNTILRADLIVDWLEPLP